MFTLTKVLLLLLLSFLVSALWAPFLIDFLYRRGIRRQEEKHKPIYRYLQIEKTGLPSMGGLLVLFTLFILVLLFVELSKSILILLVTMLLFAGLGGFDDLKKLVLVVEKFWGLRRRHIFALQWVFAFLISFLMYKFLGFTSVSLPPIFGGGSGELGYGYIVFAALVIVSSSNAFNITDGIDGLSSGLLIISLSALLILALLSGNYEIAAFIAIWIGSLFVYLYFNIHPARFMMGDVGAQPFGAMLGVIALLLDQSLILPIIGGIFVIEAASSGIQIFSKRFFNGMKVFVIAPLHYHFQAKKWSEGKICMRFWLFGALLAYVGLLVALWGK